jgi:hypothetical protein
VLLLALVLLAAGTCALPRPGLPPTRVSNDVSGGVWATASTRYRAGPIRPLFLGDGYRDVWATPVRVERLRLGSFAGGLTPVRRGGGNQTRTLHLRGADGRRYAFRSVDKDQATGMSRLARATIGRVRQDQIGALLPGAALVAAEVAEAAGVPHATPRLFVMANDSALGPHRADFGGLLGMLEEYPSVGGAGPFAAADSILDTAELAAHRRANPSEPVDARAFLAARLLDVYLGDWDRHEGQWRWARMKDGAAFRWVPIPRDRDYAMVDYRGLLPAMARVVDPKIVRFDDRYRDLGGLMVAARALDRAHLCALPPAVWDSAAAALRDSLSDPALAAALRRLPPEYLRAAGADLSRTLHQRRDHLPDAARRFRAALHADGGCEESASGDSTTKD